MNKNDENGKRREILTHEIPKAYKVRLGRKDYITHPGLLALGHQERVTKIKTVIIKCEKEECVVKAKVQGPRGKYTGLGDASPENVPKMLKHALLRMAETRAINRALRFYLGIGLTSLDELPDQRSEQNEKTNPAKEFKLKMAAFVMDLSDLGVSLAQLNAYLKAAGRPIFKTPEDRTISGEEIKRQLSRMGLTLKWLQDGGVDKLNALFDSKGKKLPTEETETEPKSAAEEENTK